MSSNWDIRSRDPGRVLAERTSTSKLKDGKGSSSWVFSDLRHRQVVSVSHYVKHNVPVKLDTLFCRRSSMNSEKLQTSEEMLNQRCVAKYMPKELFALVLNAVILE